MVNKRYKLKEQGITLLALVVTIIVLLILAATSYTLILGNEGIFNKAKYGTNVYENAVKNEQKALESEAELIDKYVTE